MKKQLSILLMAAALLAVSCGKDDDTPAPKTKTQLLTQATWKFKSATVGGAAYSFPACQTDNILTFNTSGAGAVDEGATKCNPTDLQNNPFTWSFANSETTLNVSSPLFVIAGTNITSFTIVSLTETELTVSFVYSPPLGPSLTIVVTFQH